MKKLLSLVIAFIIVISAFVNPVYAENELFSKETIEYYKNLGLHGTVLNVYNWGEYIDDEKVDVITQFERLTGCDVNYTTFESNENMYSKLSGGGVSYDIIIPSDYMVERLISEDMLLPLDYKNIPNYSKYFDEDKYGNLVENGISDFGVIYNVGSTILIYNKNFVKEEPTSWKVLWDEQYKGKILMFNNPRDSFAIAQFVLGQSINTTEKDEWDAAAALLMEQRQKVKPEYVMDEVFIKMESGEYAFATYYAGDFELMVENNPNLGFVFPEEGVNTFYDAMCIPSASQNKKGAEAFINFMLEPEIALANAEYIYYATPNKAVLQNEDYSLADSEAIYPDELKNSQAFHNLPTDTLQYMNTQWMKVKGENDTKGLYTAFFSVIAVVIVIIIANILKKNRMKKYYNV